MSDSIHDAFAGWPDDARLWIYNADRGLAGDDLQRARTYLATFAQQWVSHNTALRAYSTILYDRMLVLGVDQGVAGASGCSIDASVRAVARLGEELGVDFFNRFIFLVIVDGAPVAYTREEFESAFRRGDINEQTLVVDPLVTNVSEARAALVKRLSDSWHARMV